MQQQLKRIVGGAVIALLTLCGALWYYHWSNTQHFQKWYDYVPEDALLVWQSGFSTLDTVGSWRHIPLLEQLYQNLQHTAYLWQDTALQMPPVSGYSLHMVKKGQADFIGYLTFESDAKAQWTFQQWQQKKYPTALKKTERNYQNQKIIEIQHLKNKKNIALTQQAHFIFFSASPTLIENLIRRKQSPDLIQSTQKHIPQAVLNDSVTKLYLNGQHWHEFLNLPFLTHFPTHFVNSLFKSIYLEVNATQKDILLNGFSVPQAPIFEAIQADKAAGFQLKNHVSQQTQWLLHLSFQQQLPTCLEYIAKKNATLLQPLIAQARQEAYLAQLGEEAYAIAIQLKNQKQIENWLQQSTTQAVKFGKYQLRATQFNVADALLQNGLFATTWYEIVENVLILANSKETLKMLIDDIAKEAVWGKSVRYQELTAQSMQSAHISFMLNTALFQPEIEKRATPEWKNFITHKHYDTFTFLSAQWKFQAEGIYTNVTLRLKSPEEVAQENQVKILRQNFFQHPLLPYLTVTTSHIDQSKEVLVQDQQQLVYLIAANGKYTMTYLTSQPLVQPPQTVDWFKNGKTQYVLTTPEKIYLIDRHGEVVKPTPIHLPNPEQMIAFSNIIDYDGSQDYRILLADTEGNLYLFDKNGKNLAGWTPRYIRQALAMPPFHLRVAGKDYLIAVAEKGIVHVLNRKGENYPNFSVDLKAPILPDMAVKAGNSPQETFFTLLTTENELITLNLLGNMTRKMRLQSGKQYVLAPNKTGNNFVVAATSAQDITIFNENLQALCQQSGNYQGAKVAFYGFQQATFYAIFLPQAKEIQLLNATGDMLHTQTIKADGLPAILYNSAKKEITLYLTFERQMNVLQLRLP